MRRSLFVVGSLMAGVFILQAGNGMFASFLALRMTIEHFPTALIGLVVTGYPIGFLGGCVSAGRLIRSVGHIRAFAAFAATLCCATLAFALYVEPFYWLALRVVTGFAASGLFMVGESWLSAKTPSRLRGKVFAMYMISNMTATSASQMMLAAADPAGLTLFMVAAGLFSACLIPVALTRASAPPLPSVEPLSLSHLYRVSPLGVVGCIAAGLINTAVGGVGPVFASRIGLDNAEIGGFMAALLFGGLLLQWPIGRLSDRYDRRHVLLAVTIAMTLLALIMALFGQVSRTGLIVIALIYGGLAYTVYPICVTHANDHTDRRQVVSVSSGLLLSWAAGSIAGPALATLAMTGVGPGGLFFYVALVAAGLSGFIVWRMRQRAPVPTDLQGPFVPQKATTPVAAGLDPRAGDQMEFGFDEAAERAED